MRELAHLAIVWLNVAVPVTISWWKPRLSDAGANAPPNQPVNPSVV